MDQNNGVVIYPHRWLWGVNRRPLAGHPINENKSQTWGRWESYDPVSSRTWPSYLFKTETWPLRFCFQLSQFLGTRINSAIFLKLIWKEFTQSASEHPLCSSNLYYLSRKSFPLAFSPSTVLFECTLKIKKKKLVDDNLTCSCILGNHRKFGYFRLICCCGFMTTAKGIF